MSKFGHLKGKDYENNFENFALAVAVPSESVGAAVYDVPGTVQDCAPL